jgi:hypothetical protein
LVFALNLWPATGLAQLCVGLFAELVQNIDLARPENFAGVSSALFLGDGSAKSTTSQAPGVAAQFPTMRVVQGDSRIRETTTVGNLTRMHIDHTKRFPLGDNSFERIVLRNGLCACFGNPTCAEIPLNAPHIARFFTEVGRVLDKNNSASAAYLHGQKGNEERLDLWQAAAELAMREMPDIQIDMILNDGQFAGVRIVPRRR